VTIIELPEGTHQYKFLVDGVWKTIATEVLFILSNSTSNYYC